MAGAPRLEVFSLEQVAAATQQWSRDARLGHGGFGVVYGGRLSDGRSVAVKRLRLGDGATAGSSQARRSCVAWRCIAWALFWRNERLSAARCAAKGDAEFLTEVAYAVLIQHANLLPVLGIVRAARVAPAHHETTLFAKQAPLRSADAHAARAGGGRAGAVPGVPADGGALAGEPAGVQARPRAALPGAAPAHRARRRARPRRAARRAQGAPRREEQQHPALGRAGAHGASLSHQCLPPFNAPPLPACLPCAL
jgi:hypothetical protein